MPLILLFFNNYVYGFCVSPNTLTFANIAYSEKSPGRTFQLDEDTLVEYLDRLENLTDGAFRYDETAGVKQVYRDRKIASTELLHRYYLK